MQERQGQGAALWLTPSAATPAPAAWDDAAHLMRITQDSRLNSMTSRPPSRAAATGARQIWLLMLMSRSL
jgi:hypothetical protein